MTTRPVELPRGARLIADRAELDFLDVQSMDLPAPMTALQAWDAMLADPLPGLDLAFRIRDAISARFGVRRIGKLSGTRPDQPVVGDRLDFFLIEELTPGLLALTERDRHLEVMTCILVDGQRLSVIGSVRVKNLFGRIYMLPVAPAHRLIVRAMFTRLRRSLSRAGPGSPGRQADGLL